MILGVNLKLHCRLC